MNNANQGGFGESFGADILGIVRVFRERLRLIVLCVVAALLAGVFYLGRTPKVYRAQAILQVEQEEKSLVTLGDLKSEDLRAVEVLRTIEQNITSPGLLLRVIQRNNLTNDPSFLPGVPRPASDDKLQSAFGRQVSARLRAGSRLIDISVEDRQPAMAKKLTQLLIDEFIREGFQGRFQTSQMAHDFMVQEAARLRDKLAKSEEALQAYREKTQSVSLEDKQNIIVDKLKEMNLRVTEAKAARLRLETDSAQLARLSASKPEQLLSIASVATSAPVLELQRSIHEKEGQIATLQQRYKPRHPKYIAALSELEELKAGLAEAAKKGVDTVAQSYESAVVNEQRLENALREQERIAIDLNKRAIAYGALNSEVQSDRALYESVLKGLKESDLTKDIARSSVRLVSAAMVSDSPVKPSKKRTFLLSLFGGLAMGCGLALFTRAIDSSLRTVEDAEQLLGIPALAVIPRTRRMKSLQESLQLLNAAGSRAAESFRTLRASLSLMERGTGAKSILFTSAVPSEGKSFCAINTAIAFAQQGLKTLLIDADLRLPSVGGVFFGGRTFAGLTDVILCRCSLESVVRPSGAEHLSILCAGNRTRKAAELLSGDRFSEVIKEAVAMFDRVVVDSAPVHAVSDTLLLVEHVETTCLVVLAERTPLQMVLGAARKLKKAGVTPAGFVLNGVSRLNIDDYPGYYRLAYEEKSSASELQVNCAEPADEAKLPNDSVPIAKLKGRRYTPRH